MRTSTKTDQQRIAELEAELHEMTSALAQAWDTLAPLLDESAQVNSTHADLSETLHAILAAVDTRIGAVYLSGTKEWRAVPAWQPMPPTLLEMIDQNATHTFSIAGQTLDRRALTWMFAPIIVEGKVIGAIGAALEGSDRNFTSVEIRMIARMTERASNQVMAAQLMEARERQLQNTHDLEIASRIQRSIQPAGSPTVSGFEVVGSWQPARMVGGDAWGWIIQPCGKIACFVLDIAGKGLPAALAAVSLHTALKLALRLDLTPAQALMTVNNEFYEAYAESELIATTTILTIDPKTGVVEQANAGHPPTLIYSNEQWQSWEANAPPVGVLPNLTVSIEQRLIQPGDFLVCYSDGFSEIETEQGFWGEEGLIRAVSSVHGSAAAIVEEILAVSRMIQGQDDVHDDQTLVVMRLNEVR